MSVVHLANLSRVSWTGSQCGKEPTGKPGDTFRMTGQLGLADCLLCLHEVEQDVQARILMLLTKPPTDDSRG